MNSLAILNTKIVPLIFVVFGLLFVFACSNTDTSGGSGTTGGSGGGTSTGGGTPTGPFQVAVNTDADFAQATKKIDVFGVPIYGLPQVDDARMVHAAHILAEYLDNDEDGVVDNQMVVDNLLADKSFLIMWGDRSEIDNFDFPNTGFGQDLGSTETRPEWHANAMQGRFDAAIEEVWHLVTIAYVRVYPEAFGMEPNSSLLSSAMDKARGGQFASIPSSYPSGAWYTYTDPTCDYGCQIFEYFYWGLTSLLGAQGNRGSEISNEWLADTRAKLQEQDTDMFALLTDPQYMLPSVLPNGNYNPPTS